jgi:vancomycin resistance protein VanJ
MGFSKFISFLIWGYVFLFSLWILLRLVFFDEFWWLALINTVALYIFVPLLIFLPIALWCRQWKLLTGLAFPLGVFIAFYSPFFLPAFPAPVPHNERSITAMTFNMLWSNKDYSAIAKMVAANNPDIIGLQEVPPNGEGILTQIFASSYPYHAFRPIEESHNVAILSRFPIEDATMLPNPPFPRALQATLILDNGRPLQVIVAHFVPNYPVNELVKLAQGWYTLRGEQVSYLQGLIRQRKVPNIMLCDCNFTETSETYAGVRDVMHDSFYDVGWGLGHSMLGQFFPVGRIDYIWHTKELQAINAYVASGGGSDHLPVVARLQFVK